MLTVLHTCNCSEYVPTRSPFGLVCGYPGYLLKPTLKFNLRALEASVDVLTRFSFITNSTRIEYPGLTRPSCIQKGQP
jgi:hypothetical protein